MDRDQLIAEIKKQLQEELQGYTRPLLDKIPEEQKQQAQEIKDEVAEFVKQNPLLSVSIAAVAGFLLGRLFYRQGDEE